MLQEDIETVFANKDLLDPETIIDEDRIVGRDQQLKIVVDNFKHVLDGEKVDDLMLHGPSGTGKSLTIGSVAEQVRELGLETGIDFKTFKLNCAQVSSRDDAVFMLLKQVAQFLDVDPGVAKRTASTSGKFERLFDLLGEHFDSVVIVLDEVDKLLGRENKSDPAFSDIIYQLTRSNEFGLTETDVSVVTLSNNPVWLERVSSQTHSSFHPLKINFPDYEQNQLANILENRKDAYKTGVVDRSVIQLCAALAARDHGDARQAIDLFRSAGRIANSQNESALTEDHVREAQASEERNALHDQIIGISSNKQLSLYAVALTLKYAPTDVDKAPGPVVFQLYRYISQQMGREPRTSSTFTRYMGELDTYMMVHTIKQGRGINGVVNYYHMSEDPDMTIELLEDNTSLSGLKNDQSNIRTVVRSQLSQSPHVNWTS
jgi:cell division control protein 6